MIVRAVLMDEICDDVAEEASGLMRRNVESVLRLASAAEEDSSVESTVWVDNFCEVTVPRYTDWQFKSHFRMSRTTFAVSFVVDIALLTVSCCNEQILHITYYNHWGWWGGMVVL